MKSWSTRQSNQITCKSIYDILSEKYVCVLNRKHICMWNEEESNLEDVKKQTVRCISSYSHNLLNNVLYQQFSTNIHTIHSGLEKSSIVVFENGYSEQLSVSLTKRKEDKPSLLNTGETVCKSYLETIKSQTILVLFTSNNKVFSNLFSVC